MGLIGSDLSQYPLDELYNACQQYMHFSMDWGKISNSVQANGTIGVDVSDGISLFSHLELDPEYRLVCYMALGYHGLFGEVAAIKKSDDWTPEFSPDDIHTEVNSRNFNKLRMPECVLPPMEAIFNDGSAEGYFEAVLFALFLQALPYVCFEQDNRLLIMNAAPNDYEEKWNYRVALIDWKPRYSNRSIIALQRKYENGFGRSDGKDRIYLTQFTFYKSVNESLLVSVLRTQHPASLNHITSSNRYSETKNCCVFSQSAVVVAKEK